VTSAAHSTGGSGGAGWRRTLLLVAVAAAALAPGIVGREPMPPDEPRFAVVGMEMYHSGDWVLPTRFGKPYLDKPPLLFWGEAALFAVSGGPSGTAARLPPLLATLALVALTHRSGRRWIGEPAATAGTLMLASAMLVLLRGSWLTVDPLLALGAWGAIDAGARSDPSPAARAAGGGFLAIGVLAKGPVVLAFVALAWVAARAPGTRGLRLRPLVSLPALATVAAMLAPWAIALVVTGRAGAIADAAWHHSAERYVASWDNVEPWWYHLLQLFYGWAPWSVLLLPAAWPGIFRRLWHDPRTRWLLMMVAAAIVFFSMPAGKRGVYLLPVYPAIALLAGVLGERLLAHPAARRVSAGLGAGLALLVAGVAAGVIWPGSGGAPLPPAIGALPTVRVAAAAVLGLLAAGSLVSAAGAWRGRRWWLAGPVLFAAGSGLLGPPLLTPALNAAQGGTAFARRVQDTVGAEVPLGATESKREVVSWCLQRRIVALGDGGDAVGAFLAQPGPQAVVGGIDELGSPEDWPDGAKLRVRGRIGRDRMGVVIDAAAAASQSSR
jgi:4-amino-4-deoxy-L-arabinose transferase-like glycosyltransferase